MEGLHQRCGPGYGDEEWWSALSYAEQVEAAAEEQGGGSITWRPERLVWPPGFRILTWPLRSLKLPPKVWARIRYELCFSIGALCDLIP